MERPRSLEVTLLSDNVHLSPTMDQKGTPLSTGESSIAISKGVKLGPLHASTTKSIHISPYDNYIGVTGEEHSRGPAPLVRVLDGNNLLPQGGSVEYTTPHHWNYYVGKNPSRPPEETFGKPEPLVKVKYLGHPDHLVARLMLNPHTAVEDDVPFDHPDSFVRGKYHQRSIIACAPPRLAVVSDHIYSNASRQKLAFQYDALCMMYSEVSEVKKPTSQGKFKTAPSSTRISFATIAQSDKLLRIYHGQWHYVSPFDKSQRKIFAARLAGGFWMDQQPSPVDPHELLQSIDYYISLMDKPDSMPPQVLSLAQQLHRRIFVVPKMRNKE